MSFEREITAGITGKPRFSTFPLWDSNPVSGQEKIRIVSSPNASMREVHRRLREVIRCDCTFAYAEKGSASANAEAHVNNRFFYQTDLAHAYQSVPLDRMAAILVKHHKEWKVREVEAFLRNYCFAPTGGLITGANASPDLFSLYAAECLDGPLTELWMPLDGGWIGREYTRYCDDLTFSSPKPISASMRRRVRKIIEAAGFKVNDWKSTVRDLSKGRILICGVGLEYRNHKPARLFLPRPYLRKIRGMLHLAAKGKIAVSHDVVNGFWSVFSAIAFRDGRKRVADGCMELNATEQRIVDLYHEYRARYPGKFRN